MSRRDIDWRLGVGLGVMGAAALAFAAYRRRRARAWRADRLQDWRKKGGRSLEDLARRVY